MQKILLDLFLTLKRIRFSLEKLEKEMFYLRKNILMIRTVERQGPLLYAGARFYYYYYYFLMSLGF